MRLLVVYRGKALGSPEGHQAIPFDMYERELKERLGLEVEQVSARSLEEVEAAVRDHPADVAAIILTWRVKLEEVAEALDRLRAMPGAPRLAFLDYTAPAGSPFLSLIRHVDCYVKRQRLVDDSLYLRDHEGGHPFTDFLVREMGYDLGGWSFGTRPDAEHLGKMTTGWNLGVTPRYRSRLRLTRHFRALWRLRPIDIHQRFSPEPVDDKPREWYEEYRHQAALKLAPLKARWRMTGTGRIPHRRYLVELLASKVVVSPFGWGEVCFRDYESVVTGSLLVKPSMEHLKTHPDIYKAHETYVPVRWDLSDLADVCEYYLNHPAESMRIIANAQEALHDYYERGGFVEDVRKMLEVALRGGDKAISDVAGPSGVAGA